MFFSLYSNSGGAGITTTGCQSDRCGGLGSGGGGGGGGVVTPCTPGDPLTHYHHRNNDHYNAAFAGMNRMRIHSQVKRNQAFKNK